MKPITVHKDILEAIRSGDNYIQVGDRKFLLFEVEQIEDANVYEVTDAEEEKQLLHALREDNPVLADEKIDQLLGNRYEG